MKFLIINTDYPEFLSWLYTRNTGLEEKSYDEQMRVRMDSLFGVADFYSSNLKKLGHEAWDIHANNQIMQNAWAREHGIGRNDSKLLDHLTEKAFHISRRLVSRKPVQYLRPVVRSLSQLLERRLVTFRILSAQIKNYRPDVLLNQNIGLNTRFFREVKPYVRLLVGQDASPLPKGRDFSAYDLMISSLPNFVDYFRRQGLPSEVHRLGFEPSVIERLGESKDCISISFVGNLSSAHSSRRELLEYVCQRAPVDVWGHGSDRMLKSSPVAGRYRGSAWGHEMYRILGRSMMTLNHHIDVAGPYANNMRLYEATGVGTLLITDWKENLSELFVPGKEVLTYRSPEECSEFIQYYLKHDDERKAIAAAGLQRTLREHTYYHRMQELVEIVRKHI